MGGTDGFTDESGAKVDTGATSDPGANGEADATLGTAPVKDPLVHALTDLRRWMIVLTFLVAAVLLVVGGFAAWTLKNAADDDYVEVDAGPNPAMVQPIKDSVTGIYGDQLESVEVYQVAFTYPNDSDLTPDRPFAVSIKLRGSAVTVCGLVDEYRNLGEGGLTPTMGTLESQLSMDEYRALLGEWEKRSSGPMGAVYPYASDMTERYEEEGDTVTVDGEDYLVEDLWCVNEGWVPPPGVDMPAADVPDLRALVFVRDKKTGAFTYVGSEPSQVPLYEYYDGDC